MPSERKSSDVGIGRGGDLALCLSPAGVSVSMSQAHLGNGKVGPIFFMCTSAWLGLQTSSE